MTTWLQPYETAIFVKAPCSHRAWNASLSRCAWPLLIRSLANAASLNEGFPEMRHRCLRIALPVAIACQLFYWFHTMSEKPPKQMKGFGRKLLSRRRHFSYHAWPSGKGIKSGISPLGPTTSDSDAMPTFQKVNYANSEGGLPPPRSPATDASHT